MPIIIQIDTVKKGTLKQITVKPTKIKNITKLKKNIKDKTGADQVFLVTKDKS